MKKFLLFTCAIWFAIQTSAQTFTEGRFVFNVTGSSPNTVEFSMEKDIDLYNRDTLVSIPEKVTFDDVTYTVTSIAREAFFSYPFIKTIEIPNTVTLIGDSAFYSCPSLKKVNIPNSVTKIGNYAFAFCNKNLESVVLPNSVKEMGTHTFYACGVLKSVVLPDSLTEIKEATFVNCTSLSSINIPNSVKIIGPYSFESCKSLTSIQLPDSVTKIENYTFADCISLKSINLNSVKEIGFAAFAGCSSMSFVFIPKSVIKISDVAFGISESITDFPIIFCEVDQKPDFNFWSNKWSYSQNIVWGISNPFSIDGLKYYITDATHVSVGCDSTLTDTIVIPEKVTYKDMEFTVNAIMDEGFSQQYKLKSVVIPESVTKIGEKAFYSDNIISLDVPSSVTSIGASAFSSILNVNYAGDADGSPWGANVCNGEVDFDLKFVFSDSTRTKIVRYFGKDSVVVIPNTVKELGKSSFTKAIEMKHVELNNVEKIDDKAFRATGLQEISLSNKIKYIGTDAFFATSISKVLIPSSVDTLGGRAFATTDTICCTYATRPSGNGILWHPLWNQAVNTVIYNCKLLNVSVESSDSSTVEVSGHVGIDAEGAYWYEDSTTANIKAIPGEGYDVLGEEEQSIVMTADTSITVSFRERPSYTITYIVDGETYKVDTITAGADITAAEAPSKTGYSFIEWLGLLDIMPDKDIEVTALYEVSNYILTYKVDGEVYQQDSIAFGDTIVAIKKPTKEGYAFSGWKNVPTMMPAKDVTVTGSFKVKSYVLTYKVDGEVYQQDSIAFGDTIVAIKKPTKEGYTFSGWKNVPTTMPAKDVTVTGSFKVKSYVLTYKVDGEVYQQDSIDFGDTIVAIKKPTKEGYTFSGWKNVPTTMPAKDVTVTGSFKVKSYVLTYKVDDKVYKKDTIKFGDSIVPAEAPKKDGYEFSEWKNLPMTMPAKNITVIGIYTESTNVPLQENDATLVWAQDGQIIIHTEAETPYCVYNMLGQQKAYGETGKGDTQIILSQKGIYIVFLKNQKYKVIIR